MITNKLQLLEDIGGNGNQKIYQQPEEPSNAPNGALWVDTDADEYDYSNLNIGLSTLKEYVDDITASAQESAVEAETAKIAAQQSAVEAETAKIAAQQSAVEAETAVNSITNIIYPVGSIYMSVNNVSPQTLFGGAWEQVDKIVNTDWQDFIYTNPTYIGTSQSSYTQNKWRVKDNVLYIHVGVGATSTINTASEDEIARIPITGNTSIDNAGKRIWNAAVGGGGAVGGFGMIQEANYIKIFLKPHTSANNHASGWYSTHFTVPMDYDFVLDDSYIKTVKYIWKRVS